MYEARGNETFNVAAEAIRNLTYTLPVPTTAPHTQLSIKRDNVLNVPYIIPTRRGRSLSTKLIIGIKLHISIYGIPEVIDATSCNGSKESVFDLVMERLSWRNDNAALIANSLSQGYEDFVNAHLDAANDALVALTNATNQTIGGAI